MGFLSSTVSSTWGYSTCFGSSSSSYLGAGSITSVGSSLGASGCSVSSGAFCSVGGLTSASNSAGFSGCCSSTFTSAVSAGFSSTGAGYSSSFPMSSSSLGAGYGILVVGTSYSIVNS